jgi:long-chain acyl-CoA synthetase
LSNLGLNAGERIAIMGDVCEEWLICDLAAQSLGAIVYGIYPTASAVEVEYQLRDGGASIFIAEDQEYVDKVLPLIERLPNLRSVIVIDASAMFDYDHPKLTIHDDLLATADTVFDWLAAQAERVRPEDPAFIVYTSGTTGHPKGALIAHGQHLAAAATVSEQYPTLTAKPHRTIVYLPLCHVLGRDIAVTLPLFTRLMPHFAEDPEDLATAFFETAPTVLFIVPRYLQKFASQVLVGIMGSSKAKRTSYELAMRYARAHARRRWTGSTGAVQDAIYSAVHAAVFRPILNKLGFDQLDTDIDTDIDIDLDLNTPAPIDGDLKPSARIAVAASVTMTLSTTPENQHNGANKTVTRV